MARMAWRKNLKNRFVFISQGQKLSTEVLNRSVLDRTRMAAKCTKTEKSTCKACKTAAFSLQFGTRTWSSLCWLHA